jgi:hypothetical protein
MKSWYRTKRSNLTNKRDLLFNAILSKYTIYNIYTFQRPKMSKMSNYASNRNQMFPKFPLLTDEQIKDSPSKIDDISCDQIRIQKIHSCKLIQEACVLLEVYIYIVFMIVVLKMV